MDDCVHETVGGVVLSIEPRRVIVRRFVRKHDYDDFVLSVAAVCLGLDLSAHASRRQQRNTINTIFLRRFSIGSLRRSAHAVVFAPMEARRPKQNPAADFRSDTDDGRGTAMQKEKKNQCGT